MRLLIISNFYPPANLGGYALWCQEVVDSLRGRGHEAVVLTSRHGAEQLPASEPTWIRRQLYLEMELAPLRNSFAFFTSTRRRERANLTCLQRTIDEFEPDLLFIWGMWNLPRSLAAAAELARPERVIYFICDYWPALPSQQVYYWQAPSRSRLTALPKLLLRPVALRLLARSPLPPIALEYVLVPSAFVAQELQRKGVAIGQARVVVGGIDLAQYAEHISAWTNDDPQPLELLFTGRVTADKGVHTAVRALATLIHQHDQAARLTIVGGLSQDYAESLRLVVQQANVNDKVVLLGSRPAAEMSAIYARSHVLLFTSEWPEPFARVPLEAMAAGLPVVAAPTGGTAEVLVDDENALLFAPGDEENLARQVLRLVEQPELRARLVATARLQAAERFDLRRMVDEIEGYLISILT